MERSSLTNYLTQSIVGTFIYFGYGLGLYKYLGVTASFGVGILLFILQLGFCHWWLKNHKQGPFEEGLGVKLLPGFFLRIFPLNLYIFVRGLKSNKSICRQNSYSRR
ncbi:MAG: DUF418 domain-containing protein [Parabacteroides sp.]